MSLITGNSSKSISSNANSSAKISDQMLSLRADIEKAIEEDLNLLKPTIDLSQLSIQSLADYKKFEKIIVNKEMVDTKMDENEVQLNRIKETMNEKTDQLDVGSDVIIKSTDNMNKCFPSFKRMANKLTLKAKNNCKPINDNSEQKVIEVDEQRVGKLVESGQQLHRLQNSNKFIKSFNNN